MNPDHQCGLATPAADPGLAAGGERFRGASRPRPRQLRDRAVADDEILHRELGDIPAAERKAGLRRPRSPVRKSPKRSLRPIWYNLSVARGLSHFLWAL